MTRIYIAGPMTGLPDLNFPAFNALADRLRATGFEVINPVDINPDPSAEWHDCMRADIAQLVTCEAITFLPGWENSRGAKVEQVVAFACGMRVLSGDELEAL